MHSLIFICLWHENLIDRWSIQFTFFTWLPPTPCFTEHNGWLTKKQKRKKNERSECKWKIKETKTKERNKRKQKQKLKRAVTFIQSRLKGGKWIRLTWSYSISFLSFKSLFIYLQKIYKIYTFKDFMKLCCNNALSIYSNWIIKMF